MRQLVVGRFFHCGFYLHTIGRENNIFRIFPSAVSTGVSLASLTAKEAKAAGTDLVAHALFHVMGEDLLSFSSHGTFSDEADVGFARI